MSIRDFFYIKNKKEEIVPGEGRGCMFSDTEGTENISWPFLALASQNIRY